MTRNSIANLEYLGQASRRAKESSMCMYVHVNINLSGNFFVLRCIEKLDRYHTVEALGYVWFNIWNYEDDRVNFLQVLKLFLLA